MPLEPVVEDVPQTLYVESGGRDSGQIDYAEAPLGMLAAESIDDISFICKIFQRDLEKSARAEQVVGVEPQDDFTCGEPQAFIYGVSLAFVRLDDEP
jgi:hypothetical protein